MKRYSVGISMQPAGEEDDSVIPSKHKNLKYVSSSLDAIVKDIAEKYPKWSIDAIYPERTDNEVVLD